MHGYEFDDIGLGGHNGSVTLPPALALADSGVPMSGRDLVAAIVTGIEVAARVGACLGANPHVRAGFHGPSLIGTFASVATSCESSDCRNFRSCMHLVTQRSRPPD